MKSTRVKDGRLELHRNICGLLDQTKTTKRMNTANYEITRIDVVVWKGDGDGDGDGEECLRNHQLVTVGS